MKRSILYNLLFLFSTSMMFGENTKLIHFSYSESDFEIDFSRGYAQISSSTYDMLLPTDTLSPALPYLGVFVLVAPDDVFGGFSYSTTESVFAKNATLLQTTPQMPANCLQSSSSPTAYIGGNYPSECIEYTGEHMMDGYKFFSFKVCPFRYEANERILFVENQIDISLITNKSLSTSFVGGQNMREQVREMVVNGNELEILYNSGASQLRAGQQYSVTQYDYAIITSDTLKPIYERLAAWKTKKGVRTCVKTVEAIATEYSGNSMMIKIKKALNDLYLNKGIKYAVLGGDVDIIPAFFSYVCVFSNTDGPYVPTDLFYACFDGDFEWNADGDDIFGEYPSDNADMDPEIHLSRISISRASELSPFIDRIINYESCPDTLNWEDNILMCGTTFYTTGDAVQKAQSNYVNSIQPYWNCNRFRLFDTLSDYPDGANYDITEGHMQLEVAKGYTFIDVYAHGGNRRWGWFEDGSSYNVNTASQLVNQGSSVITTMACFTNAFDRLDACLSETFIRNPNSGILAYLGNTREGWVGSSSTQVGYFYKSLLRSNDKCLGEALTATRNHYSFELGNVYSRWITIDFNMLGDPEMPVYTAGPLEFENISLSWFNQELTLDTGVDSCRICVSSAADCGESYYVVFPSSRQIHLLNVPCGCYVSVCKPGYIPYLQELAQVLYVQNQSFSDDASIASNIVVVGRNVTNAKAEGPVVVKNGELMIDATEGVVLQNDFKVNVGASLLINTGN